MKQNNTDHLLDRKLERWLYGFLIVKFEEYSGAEIQEKFPHIELSQKTKEIICFTALPEKTKENKEFYTARIFLEEKGVFAYLFIYFVVEMAPETKRGWNQRSIVLITPHPFSSLFEFVLKQTNELLFTTRIELALRLACDSICRWPDPGALDGETLSIFGEKISLFPGLSKIHKEKLLIIQSPKTFYKMFSQSTEILWSVWELIITGESILVTGKSVESVSFVVMAISQLIQPLECWSDYRPYFTLKDEKTKTSCKTVILGITNPHLIEIKKEKIKTEIEIKESAANGVELSLESSKKGFLAKDLTFLSLLNRINSPYKYNTAVKECFLETTKRFIAPVVLFISSELKNEKIAKEENGTFYEFYQRYSQRKQTPSDETRHPFLSDETFFRFLRNYRPLLPFKNKITSPHWTGLYRRWLKGPNSRPFIQQTVERLKNKK